MGEYNRRNEYPIFQEEKNEKRSLFWILKERKRKGLTTKKKSFGPFVKFKSIAYSKQIREMNFDDLVEEMNSEVECSQPLSPHRDRVFKKISYNLVCAPPVEASQIVVPSPSSGGHADIIQKLDAIETRLTGIEKSLTDKMPEKAEVQAQSKLLRECRVIAAKTHHSISHITGDLEDERYVELASELPMSSEEHVRFVEDKLSQKESTDAMMRLILKSKGAKDSVDGVLRGMFSDDLMYHYNLEGRKEKESLLKLNIFPDKDKNTICGSSGDLRP
ncbi:uncharacterized protein LOC125779418 isoform X2 [Bactrocera dorsalis]|uniref:Uncharacterized protein LOC125779418 isoform X2 n=1 Tax=Bactrocera dorsalis TaxID=27457 RepID=A0ABM3K5J2_BACDO|nr:uncharacterized protein LOC125779418 isoform X2 [Bactrocera dorsalis]